MVWRTAGSGGRATVRAKRGKKTAGHCGDLGPTDPSIGPLFRLFTIECKRGRYAKTKIGTGATVHDLLDRGPAQKASQAFEGFIVQAKEAAKNAGTPYWMVIHRRDQRVAMTYFPSGVFRELTWTPEPEVLSWNRAPVGGKRTVFVGTPLESFFAGVDPRGIPALAELKELAE